MPLLLSRTSAAYGIGKRTREKALQRIAGAKYVALADVDSFYDSVRPWHVRRALRVEIGETDERLVGLAMSERRIPQGACQSPLVANLVFSELDRAILGAAAPGIGYLRWQDDFIVWGNDKIGVRRLQIFIVHALRRMRLPPKASKVQMMDRDRDSQVVLGCLVNSGRPNIPRSYLDKLRAAIHRVAVGEFELVRPINDKINYVGAYRPSAAAKLSVMLEEALRRRQLCLASAALES
jgi:hypothetical protein